MVRKNGKKRRAKIKHFKRQNLEKEQYIKAELKEDIQIPKSKALVCDLAREMVEVKKDSQNRNLLSRRGFVFTPTEMEQKKKNAKKILESIHL